MIALWKPAYWTWFRLRPRDLRDMTAEQVAALDAALPRKAD